VDLKLEIAKRGEKALDFLLKRANELIYPENPLREAALHYPQAGGKGFRPAMLQLVCGALGGNEDESIPVSAAIEAVHVSSLIHDDWMDTDELRRGRPAVWKKWNPTIAILAGDVLYGVAFAIAGEIPNLTDELRYAISKELAEIYIKLCHGQMLDIGYEDINFNDLSIEQIKNMQYLKTGVLFEFSCVTGARLALNKLEDDFIDLIREYAIFSGTAFQIQDDIIGLIGEPDEIGKPVGSDIIEGKRTIIAVHAVNNANPSQKTELLSILGNKSATPTDIERCLQLMHEIGSINYAKALATDLAQKAIEITDLLPKNKNTELLKAFGSHMVERNF